MNKIRLLTIKEIRLKLKSLIFIINLCVWDYDKVMKIEKIKK